MYFQLYSVYPYGGVSIQFLYGYLFSLPISCRDLRDRNVKVPMFKDSTKQYLFHKNVLFKVGIKIMSQVILVVFWIKHCVIGINEYKLPNFFIQKSVTSLRMCKIEAALCPVTCCNGNRWAVDAKCNFCQHR